ncbi:MAG: hypothetical protein KKE20_00760 [Nanoarchaeota archaeon]|nr:hypothetical protein [Nanoarchaeota archaeon]
MADETDKPKEIEYIVAGRMHPNGAPFKGMFFGDEKPIPDHIKELRVPDHNKRWRSFRDTDTDSLELNVYKAFDSIRDEINQDNTPISDNDKIHRAFDILLQYVKPKYASLNLVSSGLSKVDGGITSIFDSESKQYRDMTAEEINEIGDFKLQNPDYTMNFGSKMPYFMQGVNLEILGGINGTLGNFYLSTKDGRTIGGVELWGIENWDESTARYVYAWSENFDTLAKEIIEKEEEISKRVAEGIEKFKAKFTPQQGDEMMSKKKCASPEDEPITAEALGDGFMPDSLFDREIKMIEDLFGTNRWAYQQQLRMPSPDELYNGHPAKNVSILASKLAIMATRNFGTFLTQMKEKYGVKQFDMFGLDPTESRHQKDAEQKGQPLPYKPYTFQDYHDALPFVMLYALSPKYTITEKGTKKHPLLEDEHDLDTITNYASGEFNAHFRNDKVGKQAKKLKAKIAYGMNPNTNAVTYATGDGKLDVLAVTTDLGEALMHYANYVLESDLQDNRDPSDATEPHGAADGIRYLCRIGYHDFAPLIAEIVLDSPSLNSFNIAYKKKYEKDKGHANGSNGADTVK